LQQWLQQHLLAVWVQLNEWCCGWVQQQRLHVVDQDLLLSQQA
jgi:hypothetical protein